MPERGEEDKMRGVGDGVVAKKKLRGGVFRRG